MRISDWSSDVCSSDLARWQLLDAITGGGQAQLQIETANGLQRERSLQFAPGDVEPDGADLMTEAGLSLAAPKPKVTAVNPGEPGEQAGLAAGDVVIRVGELDQPTAGTMGEAVNKQEIGRASCRERVCKYV